MSFEGPLVDDILRRAGRGGIRDRPRTKRIRRVRARMVHPERLNLVH
jgi:hypothetical protein